MLWNQGGGGGGGAGVVAKTCTSGDFFSAVDGSGNFTCATPAGSGDVTAVGDCASGNCFDGTDGSTITAASAGHLLLKSSNSMYFDADIAVGGTGNGFVFRSNNTANTLMRVIEDGYADLRSGLDLRLYDTDDSNYVQLSVPALASNFTATFPAETGTVCTTGSVCTGYQAGPLSGDVVTSGAAATIQANSVALTTDTTGNYAAGDAEAGNATGVACTDCVALTTETTGNYAAGDAEAGNATGLACTTCVDATDIATGAVTSAKILDGEIANADVNASAAILFSKLATTNTDRILGRDTAGGGAVEELTVSGGLEFTGTGIQRSALTGDVTASAGSNSTTIAANSVALTTDTTGNYAAGDAEAGKALYINATSCTNGIQTASDGTPSCITASSTPEFVSRVMTAGGTLGNYAVVMADGSDDDEVIEATTSTTQILGCSQDSDGTTSTNPVEVAVAGIARCKADTTVVAGSLVKLGATGEFALATTAEKTWGRAVTDDDGAGSAYILLFDGAEGTIDHALDLWTSIPDLTSNTLNIINSNPTVSMTSTGTLNGVNFAPAFTTSGIGTLAGFNFQPTYSHSSLVNQLYGFNMVGTYTSTDASAAMAASIMRNFATYTSSTANAEPFSSLISVDDKPVISNTTATTSTSSPTIYITISHGPVISINDANGATGGLAAMTLTDDIGFRMGGTYTETSGTLAVTNRVGFQYNEVTNTSSATAITNNIGVDIAALGAAGATTNIGIRNADTTVYTPCTDDISGNTDYLAAPACTVVNLTAGGVRDLTAGTDQIADGLDGQIVTYFFSGSNSIAFNDADNLNLTGTITLSTGDTLTLVFSSTLGTWIEISTSNN